MGKQKAKFNHSCIGNQITVSFFFKQELMKGLSGIVLEEKAQHLNGNAGQRCSTSLFLFKRGIRLFTSFPETGV